MSNWDIRFLDMAALVASWSKDPSTKVGAVIVDAKQRIVSCGYNGPPRGTNDSAVTDRDIKLQRTLHAEENAILFANRALDGCTIYVTHTPCSHCAAQIIQAGIKHVIYNGGNMEFDQRWAAASYEACAMFSEAEVVFRVA